MNREPVRDTDLCAWLDEEPVRPIVRPRIRLRVIVAAVALALATLAGVSLWGRL